MVERERKKKQYIDRKRLMQHIFRRNVNIFTLFNIEKSYYLDLTNMRR